MGDRANVEVRYNIGSSKEDETPKQQSVFFYTHWAGTPLPETLRDALKRGEPRWSDPSYLARIIFSEMIAEEDVRGETGYGIAPYVGDGDDRVLIVDTDAQTITFSTNKKTYTFPEYVKATPEHEWE